MLKFFLFSFIWMLTGNPIIAIVAILVIYYLIDRRYVGLFPSVVKPFKQMSRIAALRRLLSMNPHDSSARYELAHLHLERHQFKKALTLLEALSDSMQDEPYVLADTGVCHLALGHLDLGEELVVKSLSLDPNVQYGEPYLRLAAALAPVRPTKALSYLSEFQTRNASSCESFYRLGSLQKRLGHAKDAKYSWEQCLQTYRTLPRFRKRKERRWALLSFIRLGV